MLKRVLPVLVLALVVLFAGTAMAYTGGTEGVAGEIYKVVVEDLLNGPVGFVSGLGCIILGIAALVMGRIAPAIFGIVGGALLIQAPNIVDTLGMLF